MTSPFDLQQPPPYLDDADGAFAPNFDPLITTEQLPSPGVDAAAAYDVEQLVNVAMMETGAPAPSEGMTPPMYIQCPHPHDVLMPVSGYQLWAGNCRYMNAVNQRKEAFSKSSGDRSIALEVVHHIHQQNPAGRFLTAIDVPVTANPNANIPPNESIVSTTMWQIMQESEILQQLEKHLRETKKEKKRRKKQKRKRKKKKRKQQEEESEETIPISKLPGALQSLYYVPSYYPTPEEHSLSPEESSSSSSESSKEEEPPPPPPPKPKKPRAPPKPRAAPKPKPAPKPAPAVVPKPINFHYKPKPVKSQQAALQNEGKVTLPKGVTIRPSGKWQAQTYFAGQSRYVGVYETSRLAARAYVVVQDYLREYRTGNAALRESPKEEVAKIFAGARKAADDAVKELQRQIEEEEASAKRGGKADGSFKRLTEV